MIAVDWTDRDSVEAYRRRLVIALHYTPTPRQAERWGADLEKCIVTLARFDERRRSSPWAQTFDEAA